MFISNYIFCTLWNLSLQVQHTVVNWERRHTIIRAWKCQWLNVGM